MKKHIIYNGAEKDFALFTNKVKEQYKQYGKIVIGISPDMQVNFKEKRIKVVRLSTVALLKQGNILGAIAAFLRRKKMATSDKMQLVVDNNEKLKLHNCEDVMNNGMISSTKNVLVLRLPPSRGWGMYSMLGHLMPYFKFAYENGLDVYVDMENYPVMYNEKKGENAWEYYYKQTCDKPSDDKIIVYCDSIKMPEDENAHSHDLKWLIERNKYCKQFVILNDRMASIIENQWSRFKQKANGAKILGVKFRGTDYKPEFIPEKHAMQTSCIAMIQSVRSYLNEIGYRYIYLAVEEQETIDAFIHAFGREYVFYYPCKYISNYDGKKSAGETQTDLVGKRQAGEDYIGTIECLARCDSLIANYNGGGVMAIIMNGGKYENIKIIDNGVAV